MQNRLICMGGENGLLGSSSIEKTRPFASHAVSSEFFKIGFSVLVNKALASHSLKKRCFAFQYKIFWKKRTTGFLEHGFPYDKTLCLGF